MPGICKRTGHRYCTDCCLILLLPWGVGEPRYPYSRRTWKRYPRKIPARNDLPRTPTRARRTSSTPFSVYVRQSMPGRLAPGVAPMTADWLPGDDSTEGGMYEMHRSGAFWPSFPVLQNRIRALQIAVALHSARPPRPGTAGDGVAVYRASILFPSPHDQSGRGVGTSKGRKRKKERKKGGRLREAGMHVSHISHLERQRAGCIRGGCRCSPPSQTSPDQMKIHLSARNASPAAVRLKPSDRPPPKRALLAKNRPTEQEKRKQEIIMTRAARGSSSRQQEQGCSASVA